MKLSFIVEQLDAVAPPHLAEPWDNVGLLLGDPRQEIKSILFTIDYTAAVADEAQQLDANLIVAYHPPIFKPLKKLIAPNLIFNAARRGVAIYSPHTALDVAPGGTNDLLAEILSIRDPQSLKRREPTNGLIKLVAFVPEEAAEKVANALFAAGAGRLGNYDQCSFRVAGTGTFRGNERSSPAIGEPGKQERVAEQRIEMLAPKEKLDAIIAALKTVHSYEEPAFDLLALLQPNTSLGLGRIGQTTIQSRSALIQRIKSKIGLDVLLIAGPTDGNATIAACCAGSGGDLLDDALAAKADVYLTGEMRHHDALRAAAAGMTVVCTLHSNSERAFLPRMIDRLRATINIPMIVSQKDRDAFLIQ